ncbi:MAG TPA: hypothetical protein VNA25_03835 [Phycisphaerae bacterium]|nr:hypothetical protein [Phycisphaerae bacterium]
MTRKALAILLCVAACAAAAAAEDAAGGEADTQPASRPAVEDLSRGLLDSAPVKIIRPRGYKPPRHAGPPLPTPGSHLVDRHAKLYKLAAADWYLLRFQTAPNAPAIEPRLLLPNQLLEQIEPFAGRKPPPLLRVSGETTVYRNRSFLFLREVIVERPDGNEHSVSTRPSTPAGTVEAPPEPNRPATPMRLTALAADSNAAGATPTTGPAVSEATTQPGGDGAPSADDIMRMLSREKPGKTVSVRLISGASESSSQPSVAPLPAAGALPSGRGAMVVDRVVRIFPERAGGWWAINFEGDNTLREPPIRLLPCKLLEEAEEDIDPGSPRPVKFRVSGEITHYKGRRYLLLRKLLREYDLGQL